ncbi:MAG TPA: IS200/IS605 family transposase [Mycobacterium sp.]
MTSQTCRRARHSLSLLHAHFVLVSKYRPAAFTDAILTFAENTMYGVCAELDAELVEHNGWTDHVHMLIGYPPTLPISTLVQRLKGRTAHAVRRGFTSVCVCVRMRGQLWLPPYFALACDGPPLSIIEQYIDGQAGPL